MPINDEYVNSEPQLMANLIALFQTNLVGEAAVQSEDMKEEAAKPNIYSAVRVRVR